MKNQNNFQVTGRITKDAEVKNFASSAVARTGIAISRKENTNGEEKRKTGFMNIEAWRKKENVADFEQLKKGALVTIEGYFKPDEYQKNGKTVNAIVMNVTKWEVHPKNENAAQQEG